MTTNEENRETMVKGFEQRQPGVVDLLDLYKTLEEVYVAASQASQEPPITTTSNSANAP
jgi:hypothetical protein